jgi:fatty acid desaturase
MEDGMTMEGTKVRQNYLAIVVAAVVCFLFEAGWYSLFLNVWLDGIGRSREWLMSSGMSPALQYATALVSAAVIAMAISCLIQLTGPQTAWRGVKVAVPLWFGFVLTTWSTEYVFEVRPWSLLGVNAGFWLIGMILMGAIVGGWKKK